LLQEADAPEGGRTAREDQERGAGEARGAQEGDITFHFSVFLSLSLSAFCTTIALSIPFGLRGDCRRRRKGKSGKK
jgi:hypothetical protein